MAWFGRALALYSYCGSAGKSRSYNTRRALSAHCCTLSPKFMLNATHFLSTVVTLLTKKHRQYNCPYVNKKKLTARQIRW